VQEWLCLFCVRFVGKYVRLLRQIIIGELWTFRVIETEAILLWTLRRYSDIHSVLYVIIIIIIIICDDIYVIHRWLCPVQPWTELVWRTQLEVEVSECDSQMAFAWVGWSLGLPYLLWLIRLLFNDALSNA